ncbi:MAG: DNA-protecting protein DprA [Phycisphaerae bacterium]|nr:DNA-protecting protein DprA [Phycisphaerae bacterium]
MSQLEAPVGSPVPDLREVVLARLHLRARPGLGPVLIQRAIRALGSPQRVLAADAGELSQIEGLGAQRAQMIVGAGRDNVPEKLLDECAQSGITILCPEDARWPMHLRTIADPPVVLFMRGRILPEDNKAVGVVGSRRCTLYGREQAQKFASDLAASGLTVISGGARGVDTAAHCGALRAGGRTVVVQGCGLHHCYPDENAQLYEQIIGEDRGAVISEMLPDEPPLPENFPPRNRIIAGMSLGILVIEANLKSGSLITARLAADDYGREVFALPGRVDSPASAGTHHLLKTGSASLVENAEDVVLILGGQSTVPPNMFATANPDDPAELQASTVALTPEHSTPATRVVVTNARRRIAPAAPADPPAQPLTGVQQKIVEVLGAGELDVDAICDATTLKAAVVLSELTFLQISGQVQRISGHTYARSGKN